MSDQYMREILRVAVAQICQTIGYNATQTAPLELLQDVLDKFLKEFTRDLRRQVEHYNRTEANLNDVTLTLNSINVNLYELLDYINNVEPVPFALEVPKFPARKDSALNFLKPGSKEVLTRPVHVHDHLPPMLPPDITQAPDLPLSISSNNLSDTKTFADNAANVNDSANKSGANVLNKTTLQSLFKPSANYEDGERPTREVSSVVMTTGGYISPAVEGKMPEAMVPDIIDKLLGLDAPPPPTPPPPPPLPPVVRPPSRATNSTGTVESSKSTVEKEVSEKDRTPSTIKETKKSLVRNLEPHSNANKQIEFLPEFPAKKNKLFNPASAKGFPHDPHLQPVGNYNKKSFMMHQNAANMLLKKAKKQKVPTMPGPAGLNEKHNKSVNDKMGKMDAADKAHRKYMKMLQKMAKQGKIPPELLVNILGPDKKSKIINPAIVASMPPGPEKLQLEKLLRKQAKQRQKIHKQQMISEVQKQSKKSLQQPPPLVPIFPPKTNENFSKPLTLDFEEQKLKMENTEGTNISPVKSSFAANNTIPSPLSTNHLISDTALTKGSKTTAFNEVQPVDIMDVANKSLNTQEVKEHKLSNEPDRSKLNIFKKISKQKTPKSSSPTPLRVPGLSDAPIINLPSGTTITPAPGPSNPTPNTTPTLNATNLGRNLFPPLPDSNIGGGGGVVANNLLNNEGLKDKMIMPPMNNSQPKDLSTLNRVFGEKPPDVELVNKPKKRGRKPGSKNSPKIPGVFPNNLLKKNSKKIKMDNSNIFGPQMPPQLPPEFAAAASMGNLSFENMAQLFGNPLNPMEWVQNKHLQQQMMIMATAKERKEHKKKAKIPKQENLNSDKTMHNLTNMTIPHMAGPTNEEVQSINKKLMRMDTILKAAHSAGPSDLTIDTNLLTSKKLASPSIFPSSTSPLKSPGNTKRMLTAGAEAMANSLMPPFMLPNRPAFPNLPTNMLSMLQFPFPPRPGLIPTPGLFPTPGLGAFPTNPKNPLLPGLFPFPNLKHTMADNSALNQDSQDLTTDKKKNETNLQTAERSYCNVAPLVPDFLTKLNEQNPNPINSNKHLQDAPHSYEPDLPKTPKPRNSHSATLSQDNLMKKLVDAHTPESATGSLSGKSIPSTPGGMSLNAFEQLMKKCDSPIDLMTFNKHAKHLSGSQETGLDFSMQKKSNLNTNVTSITSSGSSLSIKTPITLNNEPIEVSDDSDETNQPQPPPPEKRSMHHIPSMLAHFGSQQSQPPTHINSFNMDDMFVANTPANLQQKSGGNDLSIKEIKKIKKQVKKSVSSNINTSLIKTDKTEVLNTTTTANASGGVGKLAGGADLIPLTSTGLAYSAKSIPYNSLTANANTSFHSHKTIDFSNTAATASTATATPSSNSVFDNLTITAAIPMSSSSANTVFDLQKKRKEHKKLKKLKEFKEGKIKKKKDKKDKNKSKEKAEKYLLGQAQISPTKDKEKEHIAVKEPMAVTAPVLTAHSSMNTGSDKIKDKDLMKKLKKEKKKEKQRSTLEEQTSQTATANQPPMLSSIVSTHKEKTSALPITANINIFDSEPHKKQKLSPVGSYNTAIASEQNDTALTVNTTSSLTTASVIPKLTLKLGSTHSPTPPRDDGHKTSSSTATPTATATAASVQPPQTAISPPREPREPSPELARISPLVTRPPKHKLNTSGDLATSSSNTTNGISAANASSLEIGENVKNSSTSNSNMIVPPPSPWLSGGTISASSVLLPHQLLQTTKQHDITTAPISSAHNTDTNTKNSNTDRQSPLTLITETSRPSSYIDAEGNRVWICPACGKVDDGSPMIGCDGCDAWYHWVCVGIFVAPKDNEDWFCRVCITRKKGLHGSDKKRKRNKKK